MKGGAIVHLLQPLVVLLDHLVATQATKTALHRPHHRAQLGAGEGTGRVGGEGGGGLGAGGGWVGEGCACCNSVCVCVCVCVCVVVCLCLCRFVDGGDFSLWAGCEGR